MFKVASIIILIAIWGIVCKAEWLVGTGIHDVTGLIGGIPMSAYVNPLQIADGIHMRLKSRTFVFSMESQSGSKPTIMALVILDAAMTSWRAKRQVLKRVNAVINRKLLKNSNEWPWFKADGDQCGQDWFTVSNLCISCTHTHSATSGTQDGLLYQLAHFGHVEEVLENIANGIAESILDALYNMQPCILEFKTGSCHGVSINRSPTAYEANPLEEQRLYENNVDTLVQLFQMSRIVNDGSAKSVVPMGMIHWLPVHPVSLPMDNCYVSGDNKGLASYYFDKMMHKKLSGGLFNSSKLDPIPSSKLGSLFLSAFAQAGNEGDVTPNTMVAKCEELYGQDSQGKECNRIPRVCSSNQLCRGKGPGKDAWESLEINARLQFDQAKALFDANNATAVPFLSNPPSEINDVWGFRHAQLYWDLTKQVDCIPAFGIGVLAGTTDGPGPGILHVYQGDTDHESPFWQPLLGLFVSDPSPKQRQCQYPKPIILDFENLNRPGNSTWISDYLELQIYQIGHIFIVAIPVELTTMAGRRLSSSILNTVKDYYRRKGVDQKRLEKIQVVLTGLSNQYSGYVTTFEEFQVQRYEGSSTLWGPNTLTGLIQGYVHLIGLLLNSAPVGTIDRYVDEPISDIDEQTKIIPHPYQRFKRPWQDLNRHKVSLIFNHAYDQLPTRLLGPKEFGQILSKDLKCAYKLGDTVRVVFQGASPRNKFSTTPTFLTVEKYYYDLSDSTPSQLDLDESRWKVVYDDGDPCTKFWFAFDYLWSLSSTVTITWFINLEETTGLYRIGYHGHYKTQDGKISPICSYTKPFYVGTGY
jgi:neutral ceramidase